MQRVGVLREPALGAVADLARKVLDDEGLLLREPVALGAAGAGGELGRGDDLRLAVAESSASVILTSVRVGQPRVLGERVEDGGRRLARDDLDALGVVLPLDARPDDALGRVDLLLGLEERDRKVLVQLLVGEVDEELLERVLLEVLEAVDVEDAEEVVLGRASPSSRAASR